MIISINEQPDCATAWLNAVEAVDAEQGHCAHNVLIEITDPTAGVSLRDPIVERVDRFLKERAKPVTTVANTIFPYALYRQQGYPRFIADFHENVLPKVRKTERWSGYYFDRITRIPGSASKPLRPLEDIISRMRDPNVAALNKFELCVFDPARDVDNSPYGGQCLSFLSFKLLTGPTKRVALTAMYRNHYYIEKLLGNIIGLGRLMECVANESGHALGPLVIHSTHATIDTPGSGSQKRRGPVTSLIADCRQAISQAAA